MFTINPIGIFHASEGATYDLPRQPGLLQNNGMIELRKESELELALEGLEGFDLIWVLFCFHEAERWKAKVMPPRGGKKRGVFATRSPHRPNFIGFSCVKLQAIQQNKLFISNHDLLDGTPILDLKPYLNYADSFISERQGWLEDLSPLTEITFHWSEKAAAQIAFLVEVWNCSLKAAIEHRLSLSPVPYPNHRVKKIKENTYVLAYRTWRIHYTWEMGMLTIHELTSGYDDDTLAGKKSSRWHDVPMHQAFLSHWPQSNRSAS